MNLEYYSRCKQLKEEGLALIELNNYQRFMDLFTEEEFKEIINAKQRRKNKRNRTRAKLEEMLHVKMYLGSKIKLVFGTCTFNNKELSNKEETRTKKLNLWIQEHFIYAIINKDFGKENEREHYHFIGLTAKELEDTGKKSKKGFKLYELKEKTYTLGFEPDLCIIDFENYDEKRLINYLLKLNNHSNKETSKTRVRVIKNRLFKTMYSFGKD